jgi:hypothetical protein
MVNRNLIFGEFIEKNDCHFSGNNGYFKGVSLKKVIF